MVKKIREANKSDIDEILRLELMSMGTVWEGEDINSDEHSLKVFLRYRLGKDRLMVLEDEDSIMGFMHSMGYRDVVTGEKVREIVTLVVHPDHFGEGIGGELISNEKKYCKDDGAKVLKIEVLSSNKKGISFYRKFGFDEMKKVMIKKIRGE